MLKTAAEAGALPWDSANDIGIGLRELSGPGEWFGRYMSM